jgi:hypothetical protein
MTRWHQCMDEEKPGTLLQRARERLADLAHRHGVS